LVSTAERALPSEQPTLRVVSSGSNAGKTAPPVLSDVVVVTVTVCPAPTVVVTVSVIVVAAAVTVVGTVLVAVWVTVVVVPPPQLESNPAPIAPPTTTVPAPTRKSLLVTSPDCFVSSTGNFSFSSFNSFSFY
jgi:hypothetical protein